MRKRDLRLEKYGISKQRYLELQAFCKQYNEWKEELNNKSDTVGSPNLDGMPKNNIVSDLTSNLAIRRALLNSKCRVVEEALWETDPDIIAYLKASVCDGRSFNDIMLHMKMPYSRDAFYDARRYFYYLLDKKIDNLHFF